MYTGLRVTHRRYPWMEGVTDGTATDGRTIVLWSGDMLSQYARLEHPDDLRATPVQPTAYGHSSTPRRCV